MSMSVPHNEEKPRAKPPRWSG